MTNEQKRSEPWNEVAYDREVLALLDPEIGRAYAGVAEGDEMYAFFRDTLGLGPYRGLAVYFQSGLRLWSAFRNQLEMKSGGLDGCRRILDFAAGWGRMTRHLVAEMGADRVDVAEIQEGAVDFLQTHLGVRGLTSCYQASEFDCNETYDAILVSSLFTHLPRESFEAWFEKLLDLTNPQGWLMFSVHGPDALEAGREIPDSGFLFEPISESNSLSTAEYGTTWVTERFVRQLTERMPGNRRAVFMPRGLLNYQDLWAIVPSDELQNPAPFDHLDFYIEGLNLDSASKNLELRGWALDRHRGAPPSVFEVELENRALACQLDLVPRPDAAELFPEPGLEAVGFRISVKLEGKTAIGDRLRLLAEDTHGRRHELLDRSLLQLLDRATRIESFTLLEREQLRLREASIARESQREIWQKSELEALRSTIRGMEASRFWKLRSLWFDLKRRFKLR